MKATNFEYDSHYLSDYGFVICSFDGASDVENVSVGSEISFNTVSMHQGKRFSLTSAVYESCYETEFDIMKSECDNSELEISDNQFRELMRWLNRREFLPFRFIDEDGEVDEIFFDASFNIEKIISDDKIYGLHLTMQTNRPFGYGEQYKAVWSSSANSPYIVQDISDEIGDTYPLLKLTVKSAGNLTITNSTINRSTVIKNCVANEVITLDNLHQIITTSRNAHKICNDFNFVFFKIVNSFENRNNEITTSIPCDIELSYYPVVKDGI